jgi:protein TonB
MDQNRPPQHGGYRDDEIIPERIDPPAATLGLRHLIGIAVVTPALLAAGVLWLHHVPAGTTSRATDSFVEVRLVTQPAPDEQPQEVSAQSSSSPVSQPDPLIENPARLIPQDDRISKPDEAKATQQSTPAKKSDPSPSAARAQMPNDRTALTFQRTLLSHIARYRRYPQDAERDGVQGIATVLFAMRRDGTVTDVWIQTTSGNKRLDAAAIDTIRRAVPLPNIPSEMPDSLNITIPVAFNLP